MIAEIIQGIANKPSLGRLHRDIQLCILSGHSITSRKRPVKLPHGATTAARTKSDVNFEHFKKPLFSAQFHIYSIEPAMVLNVEDNGEKLLLAAVRQETVIADLLEAFRQDVLEETSYEFLVGKRDNLSLR